MFSPLDDSALTDWFRRFDAAARHLPAEDRAAQHEELRQHFDALTAANVALGQSAEAARANALTRLGNPSQIGRKLDREWQQSRTGFRADISAIGFGVGLQLLRFYAVYFLVGVLNNTLLTTMMLYFGGNLLIDLAIGLLCPFQAIKARFYSGVIWDFWAASSAVSVLTQQGHPAPPVTIFVLVMPWSIVPNTVLAYPASVTRRGWYRPTLADFKVNLPRRRAVSQG